MSISLSEEQARALDAEGEGVAVVDPGTGREFRIVRADTYRRWQLLLDASPWTSAEMAALAGAAFGKLDDEDYSHYLRETP